MRESEGSGAAKGMIGGVLAVLAVAGASIARFGDDLGRVAATGARSMDEVAGAGSTLRTGDELGVAGTALDEASVTTRAGAELAGDVGLEVAGQAADLASGSEGSKSPETVRLASWARMSSADFGCLMERAWQHKDSVYNCSTGEVDPGDPCKDTEPYYAGPTLPPAVARRIHPRIQDLRLDWEHADLRAITVTLEGQLPETDARQLLGLPALGEPLPDNLQSIRVEGMGATTRVSLVGFDHMGSGDYDCP